MRIRTEWAGEVNLEFICHSTGGNAIGVSQGQQLSGVVPNLVITTSLGDTPFSVLYIW